MRPRFIARHPQLATPEARQSAWGWPRQAKYANVVSNKSVDEQPHAHEAWIPEVLRSAWVVGAVLILNIVLTLIALGLSYSRTVNRGAFLSTELYAGNCTRATDWATGFHIVINLLSSALFESGGYAMQCLTAPCRTEVDQAHRRRRWLDIGVMSVRNFRVMSVRRKLLWLVLLGTSLPIHMIYNSAIFSSSSSLDYGMIIVPDDLTPQESLVSALGAEAFLAAVGSSPEVIQAELFNGTFGNVSNAKCLEQYNVEYNTRMGTLVFLAERLYFPNNTNSLTARLHGYTAVYDYVENVGKVSAARQIRTGNWTAEGMPWTGDVSRVTITRCMTKTVPQHCRLLFSPPIALAVVALNLIKVVCIYWTARTRRTEIFLRVGDALASFLAYTDPATAGQGLLSRADMAQGPHQWQPEPRRNRLFRRRGRATPPGESSENRRMLTPPLRTRDIPPRKRWFQAASVTRWVSSVLWFLLCIFLTGFIYWNVQYDDDWSLTEEWQLGFGQANDKTNLQFPSGGVGLLLALLFSNIPQLFLSVLNWLCGSVLSCMLVTAEYNDYAVERKPLRVSWPRGEQRTSYFLSVPYRYGVPLFIVGVVFHWLLSESLFYVNILEYDILGELVTSTAIHGLGFSPIPIFVCLLLQGVVFVVFVGLGARRFRAPMPLAAHCSVALSAACHPPADDLDAGRRAVMWGEVTGEDERIEGYSHCTFTSHEVTRPSETRFYR
ncbi:hypothetical protein BO70DRAFT_374505 [Aspergillus heteromorphus CBS 117.55]|uniref:DUF6536 domain-containing protein n=1 Tax=Aspergillus heteromorphus CBS 117.55 TaxID=1448321 RepID=A0A317V1K4_9EURO|nr:uncharacterized protein BO70DRAFT_374505 [Aspergillus heteromorphus CBS 117.55]PWY67945.1 hypothetical protein BO70DRAFT_374505 [Aspergillus heteromorphus CBS 117.55]